MVAGEGFDCHSWGRIFCGCGVCMLPYTVARVYDTYVRSLVCRYYFNSKQDI